MAFVKWQCHAMLAVMLEAMFRNGQYPEVVKSIGIFVLNGYVYVVRFGYSSCFRCVCLAFLFSIEV